jgi:hypothetical protein
VSIRQWVLSFPFQLRFLKHLKQKAAKADAAKQHELPPERAPPLAPSLFEPSQSRLFD